MVVMSLLRGVQPGLAMTNFLRQETPLTRQICRAISTSGAKQGGDHINKSLNVTASRFQWQLFKDHLHFYIFLGVIPLSALVFYANVFIGPATLREIPEGYVPKQWEYFQNPVKRWFARYWIDNMQMHYERNMHYIVLLQEKRRMRKMAWKVDRLMKERADYPNYYTDKTFLSKYVRGMKLARDEILDITGDND